MARTKKVTNPSRFGAPLDFETVRPIIPSCPADVEELGRVRGAPRFRPPAETVDAWGHVRGTLAAQRAYAEAFGAWRAANVAPILEQQAETRAKAIAAAEARRIQPPVDLPELSAEEAAERSARKRGAEQLLLGLSPEDRRYRVQILRELGGRRASYLVHGDTARAFELDVELFKVHGLAISDDGELIRPLDADLAAGGMFAHLVDDLAEAR